MPRRLAIEVILTALPRRPMLPGEGSASTRVKVGHATIERARRIFVLDFLYPDTTSSCFSLGGGLRTVGYRLGEVGVHWFQVVGRREVVRRTWSFMRKRCWGPGGG